MQTGEARRKSIAQDYLLADLLGFIASLLQTFHVHLHFLGRY